MMFGIGCVKFLRPENLWKEFRVLRFVSVNKNGYLEQEYQDAGESVDGILAQATAAERDKTRHLWDQDQHTLSHTIVISGECDLKKNDALELDQKRYLVLAVDTVGGLGISSIIYLEERNDLK